MSKWVTFKSSNETRLLRKEFLEGNEYYIFPVVMSKEGVHNGSTGPLLYTKEELSSFVEAWNGTPIIVGHPKNEKGEYCSCNVPHVVDKQVVGRIFNAFFEESSASLKAEMWMNVGKTNKLFPGLIGVLENNEAKVDVSTGVLIEIVEEKGVWNNEEYIGIVQNTRPDHLAIMANGDGACSWQDGCGVRNEKKEEKEMPKEEVKFCCEDRAKELIANSSGTYDDNDLAWMTTMTPDQFDKFEKNTLSPKKEEKKTVNEEPKKEVKQEKETVNEKKFSYQEWMSQAPPEVQAVMNEATTALKTQRVSLIQAILAANSEVFTEDELKTKSMDDLRKLAAFAQKFEKKQEEDDTFAFIGNMGFSPKERAVHNEEPLVPPSLFDK
jgi:hypothetical protein